MHTPISLLSLQEAEAPAEPAVIADLGVCEDLSLLRQQADQCQKCDLFKERKRVVFGTGAQKADLLLIGEAPDGLEDELGEPFLGEVGQLLDGMLRALGLQREQVYMMNIIKCKPPHHRDPKPDEVQACLSWLNAQLDFIQPKVIAVLGRVAAQALLATDLPLKELRQTGHMYQGIDLQVIYHPAYLLRSPRQKGEVWKDLQRLQSRLMK